MKDLKKAKRPQAKSVGKEMQDQGSASLLDTPTGVDIAGLSDPDSMYRHNILELIDCIKSIQDVRNNFGWLDETKHKEALLNPNSMLPWYEAHSERRLFMRRHFEKKYQLLGQAIATLTEVLSNEIGILPTDNTLFPELDPYEVRFF